mgnify:CR=1 FL=1
MPMPSSWRWWSRWRRSRRLIGFGRRSEINGAAYRRSLGYRLLASPYRTPQGEIDIIAQDGDILVFVEVKARRRDPNPEDAVTLNKQRRIARAASAYRARHRLENRAYRFDILAVIDTGDEAPRYRLLKDAFRAPEFQS